MKKSVLTFGIILIATTSFAAFESHQAVVRTPHIGAVEIQIRRSVNPNDQQQETVKYIVTIDDQFDDGITEKNGNLLPHLTTAQKNQLSAFMDVLWQKADDEILP